MEYILPDTQWQITH